MHILDNQMCRDAVPNSILVTRSRGNSSAVQTAAKRMFDVTVASVMIVAFLPVFLLIAAMILWTGNRPSYRHTRVGRNGVAFGCLKFRTMVADGDRILQETLRADPAARREWEQHRKLSDDPRIIPGIGNLLRRSSLDELPQLFNVLSGQMSIVGPRPIMRSELEKYGPHAQQYLSVKPGLTGPWQVGGRSETTYAERVKMDVWYVENASLRTDLAIFLRTVGLFASARLGGAR